MKQATHTKKWWFPAALLCFFCLEIGLGLQVSLTDLSQPDKRAKHDGPAGMHFAIADFDGDRKPDLAVIEVASQHWVGTNYSVHLWLSKGAESAFGVSAPSGGVRVAARDVNGDDIMDLIVTSLSDEHVVAVLLNDGHGQFSWGEPSAYAALAKEPDLFFRGQGQLPTDKLTVASLRYSFDGERVICATAPAALSMDSAIPPETAAFSPSDLQVCRGRSPPLAVFPS